MGVISSKEFKMKGGIKMGGGKVWEI